MPHRTPPSRDLLRDLFTYDPVSGQFLHRNPHQRKRFLVGVVAGTVRDDGYVQLKVQGRFYRAHRLAWIYMTGEDPGEHEVDHIDGDPANNAWDNLRLSTSSQNSENIHGAHRDNVSGLLGVTYWRARGRYRSRIWADGRERSLGVFDTPEEAHAAYLAAKRELHAFNTL